MTIQQLVNFYLACIEREDRQALSKKLSALHNSVLSPWDSKEVLFNHAASNIEFSTTNEREKRLLNTGVKIAGEPERFYYGYPLYLFSERGEWYVSPLFMQEVDVRPLQENRYRVAPVDSDNIEVNLLLFQRQRVPPEELKLVSRELEGNYETFHDRVAAAFQAMGLPTRIFRADTLDAWPTGKMVDGTWVNRPILFKSERSTFTIHFRRELKQLGKDPNLDARIVNTALAIFFNSSIPDSYEQKDTIPLLSVLPMNKGQEEAARSALGEPLTVVTGPPGTGKSQVVVNLLASCALAGKSVLFASKNNKAVDVVRQRMRDLLGDREDWVLRLGNRMMMEECRQEMDGRLAAVSTIPPEEMPSVEVVRELDEAIHDLRMKIETLTAMQKELSRLDRESRSLETLVDEGWVNACAAKKVDYPDLVYAKKVRKKSEELASVTRRGLRLWFVRTILRRRTIRRLKTDLISVTRGLPEEICDSLSFVLNNQEETFTPFAEAFNKVCAFGEWRQAVAKYEKGLYKLDAMDSVKSLVSRLDEVQRQRSELAAEQFRVGWTRRIKRSPAHYKLRRYFDLVNRVSRAHGGNSYGRLLSEWASHISVLGKDLPVWIVTNLSARRALPLRPGLFDLVIIDEASQCDIPSALPLLFRARRALIIGDPHQLRHISTLRASDEVELASHYGLTDSLSRWSYNQRSLYNLAEEVAANIDKPVGFLAEHYRSHPDIVEFSNKSFYKGQLVLRTSIDTLKNHFGNEALGAFWHDITGRVPRSSRSAWNKVEIEAIVDRIEKWYNNGLFGNSKLTLGIVTPFRLQMEKLRQRIGKCSWYNLVEKCLTVGTAHRFQGDECDIMVFSPVVAADMLPRLVRWVADTDQLLNVAITRARGALHVVGDMQACLEAGGRLGEFAASLQAGVFSTPDQYQTESPAEQRVAEMLDELGIWFKCQYPAGRYRLDFLVVSPIGTRYDLEIDGRGHLANENIRSDERRDIAVKQAGIEVIRIDARTVFQRPEVVKTILTRLC